VVRKPKIQKVKEKKKKIIIKVENVPQRMILYARTVENVCKVEVVSDDIA
jgi:hypothetical protein